MLVHHPMLAQIDPGKFRDYFHVRKFVCRLWANIARVIFLCNVGRARSRQYFVTLFSREKMTLCFGPTMHNKFSLAMLSHNEFRQLWLDDVPMSC